MESYDYPIQHFEMMCDLARRLKEILLQTLELTYRYDVFGSWWFTFMKHGERYRVVYDGKEFCLRLEQNASPSFKADWRELREEAFKGKTSANLISAVVSMISR